MKTIDVALLRGSSLNAYELQLYAEVARQPDIKMIAIGAKGGPTEVASTSVDRRELRRSLRLGDRREELRGLRSALNSSAIVHAAETHTPLTAQAVRCIGSAQRLILTCWENIAFLHDERREVAQRKASAIARADAFLAVTGKAADALIREGVDESRIRVVPAAVDTRRFYRSVAARLAVRETWGAAANELIVLCPGRLIREKGWIKLLEAVASLRGHALTLRFVGDGPEAAKIRAVAETLGLAGSVFIDAHVEHARMPDYYAAADIVAVPSLPTPYWEEQFGMVLVEAMSAGCAIVTTSSGSIPQVVGQAAMLVEPYSVPALSSALAVLAESEQARAELADAARRRAVSLYDVARVAPLVSDAYRSVL